jgi:hypothetical protein
VAALLHAGVTGLEAMILQVAAGQADDRFLRATRGWSRGEWAAAVDGLRARGLVEGDRPALAAAGRELLDGVEATTDRLTEPAYRVLGEEGRVRLAELTRPMSRTVVKAGMLNPMTIMNPRP